jgi:uncharacterized protein
MKRTANTFLVLLLGSPLALAAPSTNRFYPGNLPPLQASKFIELPLGAVKPAGWLKRQLTIQGNGLTGHLDEFWPSVRDSAWKGKDGEGWERGPYYLDGLVPLAYLLDEPRLKAVAQRYLEWTLTSQGTNGWFGPEKNKDRWPLAVALKVLTQYYEATGDWRVMPVLKNYFRYLRDNPPDWPDKEWRGVRAMENAVTAYWLYNRTGDRDLLKVAESIFSHSFKWTEYFLDFPYPTERLQQGLQHGHPTHVVNIAMATKYPGLWWQQSGADRFRQAVYQGLASLDEHHGQVGGRFAGDEHLSGRRPTQGTELCAVVEYMFSLEHLVRILGDPAFADRLELLAYNGNPGACTPNYWAHQYDQQANQVLVSKAKRKWSTNDDTSNLYGLEPNFGCCTANLHQGWPKFVAHLWMATPDHGLAAVAYGPSTVRARVATGVEATIVEETDYPFDGRIRFVVKLPEAAQFPLQFRVPAWAAGASLKAAGQRFEAKAGTFAMVNRTWKPGDVVELDLPMKLRAERRYRDAVAIYRGPLVFSLKIGESWQPLKTHHEKLPVIDWEITPVTPWNYGLILDPLRPEKSIKVTTRKVGAVPFAQETAPVLLQVKGRALPEWTLADHSAGETPASPARAAGPDTALELVPYGTTRLRITEFPVIDAGPP